MVILAEFLKKVLIDILKWPKISFRYEGFGASRNSFAYYIDNNLDTGLGYKCELAFKNIVLYEIENSIAKRDEIIKYFKIFLTENEISEYKNNYEKIIDIVIIKFAEHKPNTKKIITTNSTKKDSAKNIQKNFLLMTSYFKTNIDTALVYAENIFNQIINDIATLEKLEVKTKNKFKILNKKNIIPNHILLTLENSINTISFVIKSTDLIDSNIYQSVNYSPPMLKLRGGSFLLH